MKLADQPSLSFLNQASMAKFVKNELKRHEIKIVLHYRGKTSIHPILLLALLCFMIVWVLASERRQIAGRHEGEVFFTCNGGCFKLLQTEQI